MLFWLWQPAVWWGGGGRRHQHFKGTHCLLQPGDGCSRIFKNVGTSVPDYTMSLHGNRNMNLHLHVNLKYSFMYHEGRLLFFTSSSLLDSSSVSEDITPSIFRVSEFGLGGSISGGWTSTWTKFSYPENGSTMFPPKCRKNQVLCTVCSVSRRLPFEQPPSETEKFYFYIISLSFQKENAWVWSIIRQLESKHFVK
jgi:hypothetical protein